MSSVIVSSDNAIVQSFQDDTQSFKVSIVGSGSPTLPNIVQLSDGSGFISSTVIGGDRALDVNLVGTPELTISHLDDSIRLGDGTSLVTTTTSGAKVGLDVNLMGGTVNTVQAPAGPTVTTYNNSTGLAPASSIVTVSYTVPSGKTAYAQKIYLSGTQVGTYTIKVNANVILNIRTSVTKFSEIIDLSTSSAYGIPATAGSVISVTSENNGSSNGDFDITIQVMEV